jgi:hypothetical protein
MKRIKLNYFLVLLSVLSLFGSTISKGQCTFGAAFGSGAAGALGVTVNFTTCAFGGEYSTCTGGLVVGGTYIAGSSVGTDWITVRSGTVGGPVVAFGPTPLSFIATTTGPIYLHISTNAACGTQSSCRTTSLLYSALPVLGPPTVTSFLPATACAGTTSVVITGTNFTGASAVTFGGVAAASFVVNSPTQITATPSLSAVTGVIAVTTTGGTGSSVASLTVNPAPSVSIAATSTTLCLNQSSTLTATGTVGNTYLYNPGALSGAVQTVTPLANTTYTVVATGSNGCTATSIVALSVNPLPVFSSTTATPSLLCPGDVTSLTTAATLTTGGTGPGNYTIATIPHNPVVPVGPTTLGPVGDDILSGAISLPFPFTFYGIVKNNIYISTNGFVSFDAAAGQGCCTGQVIPSATAPNDVIAFGWEDWNVLSGQIDYFTNGTAPNRKFVIRYTNADWYAGGGTAMNGQIILNESDQSIEIHGTSGGPNTGNNATVGIENATGTLATAVSGKNSTSPWLFANEAWRFSQQVITPVTNFAWDGGLTGNVVSPTLQTTNANPSAATTYTVTATGSNGCTATTTTAVTLKPTITGTAIATPPSICIGASTVLSGNVPDICGGNDATFAGTYAPATWTFATTNSNGTVNAAGAPANIVLTTGNNNSGTPGYTNYSHTITCAGTVTFNWAYNTTGIPFVEQPMYRINAGAYTLMPGFNAGGSNTQTGTASIPVAAGDVLTLSAYTLINDLTTCSVTISNFSAPSLPISGFVNFWDAATLGTMIGAASPSTQTPASVGPTTYYAQFNSSNPQACTNPVRTPIAVTVNAIPTVTASSTPSPATVCSGTSVTLSGGGATTYTWTDGINTPTDGVSFVPASSSTYTVTGTTTGCSSTATIAVNVLSGTAPTAVGDTICGPGIANLTASGSPNDTLFWYTAASGGSSVAQGTSFNPSILSDVTYYVEGNAVLGSSTQSYLTGMLDNTAGGGQQSSTNYNIFDVLAPSITLDSVTIYPGTTGPQTVNIQLANSSAVILQTIPVAINPTIAGAALRIPVGMVIPAGTGYQLGQSASSISLFRNSSGVAYPYTVPGVLSITNSAAGNTFYYFFYNWRVSTGSTTYCPSATRTPVLAKVNALPIVTASATPTSVCLGGSTTFTGGGANTYTWSDGTNTPTNAVAFTPPLAGTSTYTVTGTDANLCSATSTVTLSVNLLPVTPVATATPSAICEGGTSSLSTPFAPYTGPALDPGASCNPSYSSGTGFGDYIQNVSFGAINNTTGAGASPYFGFYSTPVVNVTKGLSYPLSVQVGTYTNNDVAVWIDFNRDGDYDDLGEKIGEIDGNGANAIVPFTIAIPATAQLGYTRMRIVESDQITTGGMLPCAAYTYGETEDYQIDIQDVATTLAWSGPASIASASSATTNVTPSTTGALTYTVSVTDANGCTSSSSTILTVNTLPAVTASPATQTVCENGSATVTGGGAGPLGTYAWSGLISDATPFTVTSSATYTVTGTDANLCSNTATAVVNMNAAPLVTASATPSTTCNNTSITATGGGASTYVWSGGLTDNTPFIGTTGITTYTVTGTDGIGCSATSSVTVTVTASSGTLAPATSNQSQNQADDFNLNYTDPSCNLIATVDDGAGGNILGITVATVNVDANAGVYNGQPFVRRWYQITPTSNGSADVKLYITQADFDNYNLAVVSPYLPMPTSGNNADPNITNIRITKNSDGGLGNSPLVIQPSAFWNGTYWELSFNTPGFSQFRVHSVNGLNAALPATITNFSGRKLNNSDMLEWTTASEQNNAYFNLQHGTDGVNFTTIAKVNSQAANGNSSSILNYNFENTKPQLGHNYYRLQQVDIDNQSSLNAKIVDIIWGTNGSTVSIYPNPTQDVLNIDLYTSKVQNTTVKVLDMSGRIVKQIQARSEAGMNKLSLSLGDIASGVYTVQVFENDQLTHVSKVKKND